MVGCDVFGVSCSAPTFQVVCHAVEFTSEFCLGLIRMPFTLNVLILFTFFAGANDVVMKNKFLHLPTHVYPGSGIPQGLSTAVCTLADFHIAVGNKSG